ncbi:MAG: RICIN domain-containing protein, partial [Oscillospiraceae bacterium]
MNKKIISLILVLFSTLQLFTTTLVFAQAEKANLAEGVYRIIAANNQTYCIAISTSKYEDGVSRPSKNEDAKAVLSYFFDKDVYKFKVEKVDDKYRFRAVHSNKVLTAVKKGKPLIQKDENGSAEQLFDVIKNSNGTVTIYTNDGLVVDVSGESKKQGAEILLWDKTGKANQQFKFVPMNNEVLDPSDVPDNLPNSFLTVTAYPKKTLYEVGETFDYTGLVAYWKKSGKTTKLSPEDFEFTMGDKNTVLHQGTPFKTPGYIKIKMKSLTANQKTSFIVNVVPKGSMYAAAEPSNSKVLVGGKEVAFDAYNIDGSNYFKVRDVAMAINTDKNNFDIEYDESRDVMMLKRKTAYSPIGSELTTGNTESTTAARSSTLMYVQDTLCSIKGYNINGSNYFGLRELSKIVDIELGWNESNNSILLNGNEYYQTGGLWETSRNQFMTVVRGLRLG